MELARALHLYWSEAAGVPSGGDSSCVTIKVQGPLMRNLIVNVNVRTNIWDVRVVQAEMVAHQMFAGGTLRPRVEVMSTARQHGDDLLEVRAMYDVSAARALEQEGPAEEGNEADLAAVDEELAWQVRAEFSASFDVASDDPEHPTIFTEAELAAFALGTGLMAIHPFAREFVQTSVGRLGYPPYTIEFLRSAFNAADEEEFELAAADLDSLPHERRSSPSES